MPDNHPNVDLTIEPNRSVSMSELQDIVAKELHEQSWWLGPTELWSRVHGAAGAVARAIHRDEPWTVLEDDCLALGEMLAWSLAFASRVGFNLAIETWQKYPAICPYCLTGQRDFELLLNQAEHDKIAVQQGQEVGRGGYGATALVPCICASNKAQPYDPSVASAFRSAGDPIRPRPNAWCNDDNHIDLRMLF